MTERPTKSEPRKLTMLEAIVCMLPVGLVVVGGVIGGLFGGIACGVNFVIMRSQRPAPARFGLALATLIGAFALYLGVVVLIRALFPSMFSPT